MVLLGIIMFAGGSSSSALMLLKAGGAASSNGITDAKASDDWIIRSRNCRWR